MHWNLAGNAHIGGRLEQQDRYLILTHDSEAIHLLILADGMGGHQGGSLAAEAVVSAGQVVWEEYYDQLFTIAPNFLLRRVCEQSQSHIHTINRIHGISPHSTCVLLLIREDGAWWTHLGDSRLYHFRKNELLCRTKDHSVVQMLVDMGRVKDEDMGRHPDQGRLLRGLGGDEPLELDYSGSNTWPGDLFILCSDGLWEQIQPEEIIALAHESDNLATAAQTLAAIAAHRGGINGDNVSVVLARRIA